MCQKIGHVALQPGATIKDIMINIGIDSPTHLNRICKSILVKHQKNLYPFTRMRYKKICDLFI